MFYLTVKIQFLLSGKTRLVVIESMVSYEILYFILIVNKEKPVWITIYVDPFLTSVNILFADAPASLKKSTQVFFSFITIKISLWRTSIKQYPNLVINKPGACSVYGLINDDLFSVEHMVTRKAGKISIRKLD